jgi:hypothetical protein
MIIIGVDFHPEFQHIASVDTETGEFQEKRLGHREEAETFYRGLAAAGQKVRVGMEASGHGRWFERLLAELQIELWIGDSASSTVLLSIDANGSPRDLYEMPTGAAWVSSIVPSPHGRFLAFTKRVYPNDIMLLENF